MSHECNSTPQQRLLFKYHHSQSQIPLSSLHMNVINNIGYGYIIILGYITWELGTKGPLLTGPQMIPSVGHQTARGVERGGGSEESNDVSVDMATRQPVNT